jgi:pimeloyl-ACP methyl ester carboxylesterase
MNKSYTKLEYLALPASGQLAYRRRSGAGPTLLFLPGYASDMEGAKALALDAFAAERGLAMLRFDYSGTGASAGRFEDGTLDGWLSEARAVAEALTAGPLVLIGSSMGGWLALLLALEIPTRVHSLVGIAAAPDFTDWGYAPDQRAQLRTSGQLERPGDFGGEPQLTTLRFWESGQALRLLDKPIAINCPVRLIHGEADEDVPPAVAQRLMTQLRSADVQLTMVKGSGHRLSEPKEIAAIVRTVAALVEPVQ